MDAIPYLFLGSPMPDSISPASPIVASVVYLLTLWIIRKYMANKPKDYWDSTLRIPLIIHNYFLSAISLIMVLGTCVAVYKIYMKHGLLATYCGVTEDPYEDEPLLWWAGVFYVSKYYELLDTVFLVLRKRELSFLHVFHHTSVLFMCWYAIDKQIVMGWITSFNNASVHVIMYYYYGQQARNVGPIWWKKYLTTLQMIQFTLDIFTSVWFGYFWMQGIPCRGDVKAWIAANVLGAFFFYLFYDFYRKTYKQRRLNREQAKKKE